MREVFEWQALRKKRQCPRLYKKTIGNIMESRGLESRSYAVLDVLYEMRCCFDNRWGQFFDMRIESVSTKHCQQF